MFGTRKFKVFVITTVCQVGTVIGALVIGVQFTGDNIIAIVALYATTAGAFFGANFGEHMAKKPASNGDAVHA